MKVVARHEIHRPGKGKNRERTEVISPGTEFEVTQAELDALPPDSIWRDKKEAKTALSAMEGVQGETGTGGITYVDNKTRKVVAGATPEDPDPDAPASANQSAEQAAKEEPASTSKRGKDLAG